MSFSLETTNMDLGDTPIENIFINDFMPMANGTFVKVYLLGFKYAADKDKNVEVNNQTIAKHLQIPLEDVLNAWNFWEEKGIIRKIELDTDDDYDRRYNYKVEFLSLKQLYIENNYKVLNEKEPVKDYQLNSIDEGDIIKLNQNPEINQMFNNISDIMRRPIYYKEKRQILNWLESFNMTPNVIVLAFQYTAAKENIRKSVIFNYVEGTLKNWYDDGLTTLEAVLEDFETRDVKIARYKEILRILGRNNLPTEYEREMIDTWFEKYNFNMEIVKEGIKRSSSASNPSLKYINGIMENWYKAGVKTLEDIEKEEERHKQEKAEKVEVNRNKLTTKPRAKKTRFHNFEQRSDNYTAEELEEMAKRKRRAFIEKIRGD